MLLPLLCPLTQKRGDLHSELVSATSFLGDADAYTHPDLIFLIC